jgi:glc operon protein GlcG
MAIGSDFTSARPSLNAAGAARALEAATRSANAAGLALSIAVVDIAGNLLAFWRNDGASVTSIEASIRKARTAAQLGVPSKVFEDLLDGGMTSLLTFDFVTASRGGLPVLLDGEVVGGIGCSGGSGEQDESVARAGAGALLEP